MIWHYLFFIYLLGVMVSIVHCLAWFDDGVRVKRIPLKAALSGLLIDLLIFCPLWFGIMFAYGLVSVLDRVERGSH